MTCYSRLHCLLVWLTTLPSMDANSHITFACFSPALSSSSHHATQTFSTTLFTIIMACHLDHRNVRGLNCSKDIQSNKQSFLALILLLLAECKLKALVYKLYQWVILGSILLQFLGAANMLVLLLSEPMLRTHLVDDAALVLHLHLHEMPQSA